MNPTNEQDDVAVGVPETPPSIDITTASEAELRDAAVPWPRTMDELTSYIEKLVKREHDYGTCVYAMSMSAVAAYYLVAHMLGATGFQASCADLDMVRRTRSLPGPFMLIDGEKALYPQNNVLADVAQALHEWRGWLADEAEKKLAKDADKAHPNVVAHWRKLVAERPPAQESQEGAA